MKLSSLPTPEPKKPKPFFEDEKIKILAKEVGNKFASFEATDKRTNKVVEFQVVKYKILDAWKKVEAFYKDLK